jgi:RNase P subunit RPR2
LFFLIEMVKLGVCPACEKPLDDFDVEEINFRGTGKSHTAYRCGKCNTIIGFSSS